MAIEAHLYPTNAGFPYFVPQFHNETQINQNTLVVDPSLLLLSDSNAYGYTPAANKHNNQPMTTPISQSLAFEFDKQRDEVDQFIRSQNEKLRIVMQEQRRQQVAALLKKVESDVCYVLCQKDEQIAEAAKKRVELEEFLTRLEAENRSWRRVAQENEAMVLSLHNTLEQVKERASCCFNNNGVAAEDAGSCCGENMGTEEEGTRENRACRGGAGGGGEQIPRQTIVCKCCQSRNSCFMFLPCRHLCSCNACEPFLQACPVCRMPKKSSIETLIF